MIDFFTKQEKLIIVFLIVGLLIGGGIKIFYSRAGFGPNEPDELSLIESQIVERSKKIDSLFTQANNNLIAPSENEDNYSLNAELEVNTIDINKAGVEDLVKLPNVGLVLANRIIEYREKKGNLQSIEELLKVKGIGEKKLASFRKYVFINNK